MGRGLGDDTDECRFIFEGLEILQGVDNGGVQAQDVEPLAVRAAGIAELDDRAIRIAGVGCLPLAPLPVLEVQRGVDERVECLGWDFQLLPALHLFEGVSHAGSLRHGPIPRPEKSPYG